MFNNVDNRIQRELDKMSINKKYQVLEQIEEKHLEIISDGNVLEPIVNILLDITTIIAKGLKMI